MNRLLSRVAGLALALAALASLAAFSGWRYRVQSGELSLLRVAFSARPERIEHCREVSEAELAARPVHMRQKIECAGQSATYRLQVTVDSQIVTERILRGGGMRHDRPISLLLEHPVPPGAHRVMVRLLRIEAADTTAVTLTDSTRRSRQPPLPASLELIASPTFNAARVLLVTYDIEQRRLVLRTQSVEGPDRSRLPGRAESP